MLHLSLLGAPQITLGNAPITEFITRKAEALVYYLAVTGRTHTRSALANLFWTDVAEERAKKNLRDILPNVRRLLGPHLLVTRQSIEFAQSEPHWLDVTQFQQSLRYINGATTLETLRTATELYHGELLEGFYVRDAPLFEEWLAIEREQLHGAFVHCLSTLAHRYIEEQNYNAALQATQRLLAVEPWHEQAHHQQMLCLAYSERTHEALRQYETCRMILAEELGLEPSVETVKLYEQIRAGTLSISDRRAPAYSLMLQPHSLLPEPTVQPTPHNLPRQLTLFVGRTMEIAALQAKLLQPDCTWLTLTGEGGVGKTRLALTIAEALLPHFPDGVWFIPLSDLVAGDELPEQLAATVGQVMGLTFAGPSPLFQQLILELRYKQLLLVLDNFEQIGAAGAEFIIKLLKETQALKVLVTSRHRFYYQAEHLFALDGLPVPEPTEAEQLSNEQLLDYGALALFVQRVTQVVPTFMLDSKNRNAIVQICQLVQGLPLAIELAAALTYHHSCTQIVELLTANFANLAAPLYDLPSRHQRIETTLAYSWQFLNDSEARSLARCALFRNGFTATAATAVAGLTQAQLIGLEGQSLLYQPTAGRYAMHELMRQYALGQLHRAPDEEREARNRHLLYYKEFLLTQIEAKELDARTLQAIREELRNICVGWEWATEQQAWATITQMLEPLTEIYLRLGAYREAALLYAHTATALRTVLQSASAPTVDLQQLLARLRLEQVYFYIAMSHIAAAEQLLEETAEIIQATNDPVLATLYRLRRGDAAWVQGNYTQHRTDYTQALTLAQNSGRSQTEVHCLSNLGMNYDIGGEYSRAIECYEAALAIARRRSDRQQEGIIYNNLGVSNAMLGNLTQALYYYQESLQLGRVLGDQEGSGFANLNLSIVFDLLGEWEQAHSHAERALKIFRMIRQRRLEARTLAQLGLIHHHLGEKANAAQRCQRALQLAQQNGYQAVQAEALIVWGHIALARRRFTAATEAYQAAYKLWQELGRAKRAIIAKGGLAQSLFLVDDHVEALAVVEEILPVVTSSTHQVTPTTSHILLICYHILVNHGDPRSADILNQAYQLLQLQAAKIPNPGLRHSFLQKIPAHHEINTLASTVSVLSSE